MNNILSSFTTQYPNCAFAIVGDHYEAVHEDCFYLNGYSPKPILREGIFLKIQNRHGGSDTVSMSDLESCHKLAQWHNNR